MKRSTSNVPKADIYQKIYWGDFLKATMHLHGYERGAYLMLIGCYFLHGGPLPDDDVRLASITALSPRQWRALRPALEPFFDIRHGCWHHARVEEDIRAADRSYAQKLRAADMSVQSRRGRTPERTPERTLERTLQRTFEQSESQSQSQAESQAMAQAILRRTRELLGAKAKEMEGR